MSSSTIDVTIANASAVSVSDEYLTVALEDGRRISIPLSWYPRLFHATEEERQNLRLIGNDSGIRWGDLDEDISIEGIITGHQSQESQTPRRTCLQRRRAGNERGSRLELESVRGCPSAKPDGIPPLTGNSERLQASSFLRICLARTSLISRCRGTG